MSAEEAAVNPATVNITSHATEVDTHHVWTDKEGVTHGSLSFGHSWIVFHDPAQVRQVAAALTGMADRMDARIAEAAGRDGAR